MHLCKTFLLVTVAACLCWVHPSIAEESRPQIDSMAKAALDTFSNARSRTDLSSAIRDQESAVLRYSKAGAENKQAEATVTLGIMYERTRNRQDHDNKLGRKNI